MFFTRKNVGGLLVLLATALLPAAVFAQARVAVVDSVQAPARLKQTVRQAVAAALDDLSVAMAPVEEVRAGDSPCADAACYASTAKRLGATHVLLVQGVANPAGYRLSLDLRDGESGHSLGTDGKDCELCAEEQFGSAIQDRVTKLWTRVMRETAAPTPVVARPPAQRAGVDVSAIPPWYEQPRPVVGLALGVVGLAAVGIGIYYIGVDGNVSQQSPIGGHGVIRRDTSKWGWTLVGVGGVAALAGTSMFVWGRDDGTHVEVVMGPASVGLHGKF